MQDGNGVVLGSAIYVDSGSILVLTSTGYMLWLNWDGTVGTSSAQLYFTQPSCGGTAATASGGTPISGKSAYYSAVKGSYLIPASVGANGVAVASASISVSSIENPTCMASVTNFTGVLLTTTSLATVGLANLPPFTTPLSLH